MSGVEVVGLVLGTIPLIISALEDYQKCAELIKNTKHAALEFKKVVRRLQLEHTIFLNTLRILLSECLEEETPKQLLDALACGSSSEKVCRALEERLQGSYRRYVEHVRSINESLEEFVVRLHLGPNGELPCNITAASWRQAYRRFEFALKKEGYLDLIKEIHDDNVALETLTGQTRTLQASRRARKFPDFETIRTHASSIFMGLQNSLQTSCCQPHKISMYLKSSVDDTPRDTRAAGHREDTFRIVLHHGLSDSKQVTPRWSIEETEIKPIHSAAFISDANPIVTATSTSTVQVRGRKVAFAEPKRVTQVPAVMPQPQSLVEIHDLCQSVHGIASMQCGDCLGYLVTGQHRHGLYSPKVPLLDRDSLSVETLARILDKGTRSKLTVADAHRLAVPLATGILKLRDTPWLQSGWSKQDVILLRKDGKILSQHPFISQDVTITTHTSTKSTCASRGMVDLLIKNATLFSLGIILIELCMGATIFSLHEANDVNADPTKGELLDYLTADRLLRTGEISDKFGKRWSDVVRRCIYCELDEEKRSLDDVAFRKAVYNKVLVELEEEHKQFFGL